MDSSNKDNKSQTTFKPYTAKEFRESAEKEFGKVGLKIRPLGPQDVSWSEAARRIWGKGDIDTASLEVQFFPNRISENRQEKDKK